MRAPTLPGRSSGVVSLCAALLLPACAAAGPGPAPSPEACLDDDLARAGAFDLGGSALVLHVAACDELVSDPRDAGLRRALALLDERLLELPGELGRGAPPPGLLEFVCAALGSPWTLRIDLDGPEPVPLRAAWTVHAGDAARASALAERFAQLLELFGMRGASTADWPALAEVETPQGTFFHGTVEDGRSFGFFWGEPRERALGDTGLPDGVRPALLIGIDLAAILGTIERHLPPDDEEAQELRKQLEFFGLLGGPPVCVTLAAGHGAGDVRIVSRTTNWTAMIAGANDLAAGGIPRAVLERIPPDATFVSLSRTEPEMLLRYVERSGENGEELLDKLYDVLGIDLGPDLLEPLGQTFGLYLSDSTGGGGLTSAVAFAAADDEERLAATLAKLAARLNDAARDELQGRVRARAFERGGAHGYELDIPGLPVPLGPCVALADGQLLLAATPQALDGALRRASGSPHAAETAASWLRHLAPERVGALDGLQSLTYVDTERFAREGYGLAALASAAVANGIRSPQDPTRDPGPVMPPFAELFAGVQPTVLLARVVGEDLVTTGSMDRSLLVHLAATLGWSPVILSGAAAAGLFASLAVPSVTMKLADAELTKAKADIVALKSALDDYALENQGKYPESLEALVVPDEDGFIWIETAEVPPDPWGNPYVYELLPDGARVLSYGADGVPGGEGDAADISSDELQDDEPGWDDEEGMEGDEGEGWMEEEGAEEDDGDEDGL